MSLFRSPACRQSDLDIDKDDKTGFVALLNFFLLSLEEIEGMRYRLPKSPILKVDFIETELEAAFDNYCNFSEALLIEG